MRHRRHLDLQCMFHLPFIRPFIFVSLACSGCVPLPCSGGVPVVFWQKLFLKCKYFSHDNTEYDKSESTSGVPLGYQTTYFHSMNGCALLGGKSTSNSSCSSHFCWNTGTISQNYLCVHARAKGDGLYFKCKLRISILKPRKTA